MESLIKYLKKHEIRASDFAKSLDTSAGYVSDLMSGRRTPSTEFIKKIDKATDGEVPYSAWFTDISSNEDAA